MEVVKITKELIANYLPQRVNEVEKREFGHALIIAGSYGMMGAACLSAKAALRSGLGLLTVLSPRCGYEILQTSVPEAMVMQNTDLYNLHHLPDIHSYKYIAIGPGIGTRVITDEFVDRLLCLEKKLIIDADAINIISKNKWQHRIKEGSLITPNLREFNRFFNIDGDKLYARNVFEELTSSLTIHVILKGANTLIYIPEKGIFENSTGNPSMAKAGSGDVLTGMILGLWARTHNLEKATLLGVYLHGLVGDLAVQKIHEESVVASDLILHISEAFGSL